MKYPVFIIMLFVFFFSACKKDEEKAEPGTLQLVAVYVGPEQISASGNNAGLPIDQPVVIRFSQAVDKSTVEDNVYLSDNQDEKVDAEISYLDEDRTISLKPAQNLQESSTYVLKIGDGLKGANKESFPGINYSFTTTSLPLEILNISIDDIDVTDEFRITGISFRPDIRITFSDDPGANTLETNTDLVLGSIHYNLNISSVNDSTYSFTVDEDLPYYRQFHFTIASESGTDSGRPFEGLQLDFYTRLDSSFKYPEVSDEQLLDLVQEQTFRYFLDFAHPVSGLIRERNTSLDVVTSGGSGFGLMTILVGIERGFITRAEGIDRLKLITGFLAKADRFHGAWSHWLNGRTGQVVPFSANDDGGDLVETSYMAMGLMTVRQYLDAGIPAEQELIDNINQLLDSIEWNWYTQGENFLTWHWSPNYGFEKNFIIRGWNEALITYVMAATSKEHGISAQVYHEGWAGGSNMINGNEYYGITLPLGPAYGGPLFFEQYTFLGLDPRNLEDEYANYWTQAVNHTLINHAYCVVNPKNYVSYSEVCWGLTASDGNNGYSAHSPGNDRGVITPTAAVSSIPFTPEISMDAIRHFYYRLGDRLWGPYGFYDAFNVTANWYADSNLAIDQGPIIIMIENYRTALLWDLFMSAPEVQNALDELGFSY